LDYTTSPTGLHWDTSHKGGLIQSFRLRVKSDCEDRLATRVVQIRTGPLASLYSQNLDDKPSELNFCPMVQQEHQMPLSSTPPTPTPATPDADAGAHHFQNHTSNDKARNGAWRSVSPLDLIQGLKLPSLIKSNLSSVKFNPGLISIYDWIYFLECTLLH